MLKVETLRSAHELDRLKARWTWLERQCQGPHYDATLFQSYELNRLAARWFVARESPNVVLAESDCGLAIIPAVRRRRELGLIGETLFDYRDVLSSGDPAVLEHAWRELARVGLSLEVTALRGEAVRERWTGLNPMPFCPARACVWFAGRMSAGRIAGSGRLANGSTAARPLGAAKAKISSSIAAGKTSCCSFYAMA